MAYDKSRAHCKVNDEPKLPSNVLARGSSKRSAAELPTYDVLGRLHNTQPRGLPKAKADGINVCL